MSDTQTPQTVDEYIAQAPAAVQPRLLEMRALIREAAPKAKERISWSMPTYTGKHNLVHFAAHKAHMGMYPGREAMEQFQSELTEYQTSKGAVQFPYTRPLPKELILRIVRFCVAQDNAS